MIQSIEGFWIVRRQIALIEDALASLREDLRTRSPEIFPLYSEGYFDQIADLRHEIDEYLGLSNLSSDLKKPA